MACTVFRVSASDAGLSGRHRFTRAITFVPLGLIVNGKPAKPAKPEVKAPVRIGKASLFVEKATEGK
jgi:hypothetical protein